MNLTFPASGHVGEWSTLERLRQHGREIDPGVFEVVTPSGQRQRWLQAFGSDLFTLVSNTGEGSGHANLEKGD